MALRQRFLYSLLGWIPLMVLNMGPMIGLQLPWIAEATSHPMTIGLLNALLTLPPVLANRLYFTSGFRSLRQGSPTMDSLVAVGSAAALVYGLFILFKMASLLETGQASLAGHYVHQLFFESAATILTLITLGKYLEARSKQKTTVALTGLMDLTPKTATLRIDGVDRVVPVDEVQRGDVIAIKAGQNTPVDGKVLSGQAYVDESTMTGESLPVLKQAGDTILAGTLIKDGYLEFEATKVGEATTLQQIIRVMEATVTSKAPVSRLVDRISRWFVPTILFLSALTFVAWFVMGQPVEFALTTGIAVLVIACPCALGLATPVAIMVGTGKGASLGLLFKSAEALELAYQVDTLFIDKTGTLTTGRPVVKYLHPVEGQTTHHLLMVAASLEQSSTHPLGKAILDKAEVDHVPLMPVSAVQVDVGAGLMGTLEGKVALIGHQAYLESHGLSINAYWSSMAEKQAALGHTVLFMGYGGQFIGLLSIADSLKPGAQAVIHHMKAHHRRIVLLTGDRQETARVIAAEAGIDHVHAGLTPLDKLALIQSERAKGRTVAMVGDGINDAPALAAATVGIAMGKGTDIAMDSADVVMMRDDLNGLQVLLDLSRKVMQTIRQNLFWAFFYNVLGIPLAAGVLYLSTGWLLSPMVAAAAMSLSSVTVVLNALRLHQFAVTSTPHQHSTTMNTILHIEGMSCQHCRSRVESALNQLEGVKAVVDLKAATATVEHDDSVSLSDLTRAVEAAGYTVK